MDCIFRDRQKSFDTFPHQRLVQKFEKQTGLKGSVLQWVKGHLNARRQITTVNDETE